MLQLLPQEAVGTLALARPFETVPRDGRVNAVSRDVRFERTRGFRV